MKTELEVLRNELKRLKQQGVSSVLLEPDTLNLLEERARQFTEAVEKSNDAPAQDSKPKPAESVTNVSNEKPLQLIPETEAESQSTVSQTPETVEDFHSIPNFNVPEGPKAEQWEWLKTRVIECPVCNNHVKPGKKVVFGTGNIDADLFFCGEAPGAEEEIQGEPFVGPAGQLLDKIIQAMGLDRKQVYIGNIMNWRPETDSPYGNRPPSPEEMAFCMPYLKSQLEIIKPKVIVALGATAVNGLLGYDSKRSITRSHGQWHEFESIPTIISFHPSYILRNGTLKVKRMIWEDMLSVMERLEMPISEKQRNFFSA